MFRFLLLMLITGFYALLYVATTRAPVCDEECKKVNGLYNDLRKGRRYVNSVYSARWSGRSDSIYVLVTVNQEVNLNPFADTVCQMANEKGLPGKTILILENGTYPYDTLLVKKCN